MQLEIVIMDSFLLLDLLKKVLIIQTDHTRVVPHQQHVVLHSLYVLRERLLIGQDLRVLMREAVEELQSSTRALGLSFEALDSKVASEVQTKGKEVSGIRRKSDALKANVIKLTLPNTITVALLLITILIDTYCYYGAASHIPPGPDR